MNAHDTFDKFLAMSESVRFRQGYYRLEGNAEVDALKADIYNILDAYDSLEIVPLCPDREDPHHWATNCWLCEHEGEVFSPFKEVGEVSPELPPSQPSPPGQPAEARQVARQLDMFEKENT